MLKQLSVIQREIYAAVILLIAGSVLRLQQLKLVPLHHDEGINGFFMMKLFRENFYRYDPANYHGPLLYYLDLPLLWLFGLETVSLRLLSALFGIGLLVLLFFGRIFSTRAAFFSLALIAVSPGMVYISRYFIHEMIVVFFTLGIVSAMHRYREQPSWLNILAGSASAGFLFATKETAAPTIVVLIIAAGLTRLWISPKPLSAKTVGKTKKKRHKVPQRKKFPVLAWSLGFITFIFINITLYSSFFTNLPGIMDGLNSLRFWTVTGNNQHVHPVWQYLVWLMQQEGALFLFGSAGILLALLSRSSYQAVFCGFWSLGMLAMYSLTPYKTPWLTLNIILPFALIAGYAIEESARFIGNKARTALAASAILIGLVQCISLNFIHYDDNTYAYVYAHTVRDLDRLVRDVEAIKLNYEPDAKLVVTSDQYWPLPWIWRDFEGARFYGKLVPLDDVEMVLALPGQEDQVRKTGAKTLERFGKYTLRPGVDLVLWADPAVQKNRLAILRPTKLNP